MKLNSKEKHFLFLVALFFGLVVKAQGFTKEDTLKGSNTPYRDFWDVKRYDLTVKPDFETKSVSGENKITFTVTRSIKTPVFQIDLQQPMRVKEVKATFPLASKRREGDFLYVQSKRPLKKGEKHAITVAYEGSPKEAENAPWDGGWVFEKDGEGYPFMSVAQQGIGASVWLPVKELWSDEPDEGMTMAITTPNDLVGVGNGRLVSKTVKGNETTFVWQVKNPINAYSIVPNIGRYVRFQDVFFGERGRLDLDYWVLEPHLELAKKQFAQVQPMLEAFEYWFGAYPFYEDSFKLVETPYLGMEHQSNVAYGNGYANGYKGTDWSGTGIGLKWDFIIVHESGHEWFANNITAKDQADMWIHESFTAYSEALFTQRYLDKDSGDRYIVGTRRAVENDRPIIGHYGVRHHGSGDMYYKGANMLHTIRQVIGDDDRFRAILRGMNKTFFHKTVTTKQVEDYFSTHSGRDLRTIFDQYLRTTAIPVLEYRQEGKELKFRYVSVVEGFNLPLKINRGQVIEPQRGVWQSVVLADASPVEFDPNYYVEYRRVD
ncbi:M1 family metallopeptidase [Bergeyella sp. RCAD1439]|uniref:M1 family metallopeptidase n=1 Tax=Bergeyella anatis TaxID=3113737 RepID=UPI002E18DCF1|nr:M1 family metallopeptidase [Bergeyella sp. RCAD1439]